MGWAACLLCDEVAPAWIGNGRWRQLAGAVREYASVCNLPFVLIDGSRYAQDRCGVGITAQPLSSVSG